MLFFSLLYAAVPVSTPVPVAPAFEVEAVRLLPGPFATAQQRDADYLLSLDPDRLLRMFRVTAGIPTEAAPLGGWESPSCELRGHSLGHYLSACSLMYGATGDPRFKARVDAIVAALAACQEKLPAQGFHPGYLSAFPESFFDRVDARQKVWAPWYTLHKLLAGLIDARIHAGNAQAEKVARSLASWIQYRVDRLTPAQMQASLETEHGGMNEALANLAALTGDPEDLRLSAAFNHAAVLDPLARREDRLDGLHANTQIPKLIGAAREFELTGDSRYETMAKFFWSDVALRRSYVFGGHSDDEHFFPVNDFEEHLGPKTAETCNTYNMLKLTRHLNGWSPSSQYEDFAERALYNDILASQDAKRGMVTYFLPTEPGHFKTFSTPDNSFWCCVGTGMENHARYGEAIYGRSRDAVYVHLFIASVLDWKERGVHLRQDTDFPNSGSSKLTMRLEHPQRFAMKIRRPGWAAGGMRVRLNGQALTDLPEAAGYLAIDREWRDGDAVSLELPMKLRTEPLPGNPGTVALLYGPIVLAGVITSAPLPSGAPYAREQGAFAQSPAPPVPNLNASPATLPDTVEPVDLRSLTFQLPTKTGPIPLIPLYRIDLERYTVYWRLTRS